MRDDKDFEPFVAHLGLRVGGDGLSLALHCIDS